MEGEIRLGDVAKVQGGFAFKSKDFELVGTPVVKIKNVRKRDVDLTEVDCVSEDVARRCSNFYVRKGDVLISMTGSGPNAPASIVGRVARHTGEDADFLINQRVGRIVNKDTQKLDLRYLYYFLSQFTVQDYLVSIATGSANQVNISAAQIESLNVPLPVLDIQKAIAHILGTLDDKIELNRQMNATLEAMAQALFKSWFVDFDPVIDNALAAGNTIPEPLQAKAEVRAALGDKRKPLPEEIQKQFPSSFVFSEEIGWIPEGWEVKQAQDVATITIGKTPPRKETHWFSEKREGNLVWVSIRDMGNSGVFINDSSEYLVPESVSKYNVKVIPKGSVLLSFKLTLGRVAIAESELTTNEAIAHFVSPKLGLNKGYIYCYLSSFDFGCLGSTSSIATAVNSKLIKAMPFIVPNKDSLRSFEKTATEWFSRMALLDYQTDSLISLRNTLLPKLLSGELRIPDAEKLVADNV